MRAPDGRSASGLKELAQLLYGTSVDWKQKVFAMLYGYFDESGKHGGAKIFALAGVLGRADSWESLVSKWIAIRDRYGLPEIHMYDVVNGRGTCELKRIFERKLIHKECYDALQGSDLTHIASAVVMDDWDALSEKEKDRLGTPYDLCFQTCIQVLANGLRKETPLDQFERVPLMFDRADAPLALSAEKRFREHQADHRYASFLGSLTFDDSVRNPPLQIADLFAYHCYRFQMERFNYERAPDDFPILPLHVAQLGKMSVAPYGLWDGEALRGLLEQIRQKEAL